MSQAVIERYRRWYNYERDAHAKVIQSLDSVPAERRSGPEFRRAVGILGHLVAARRMWLSRLGVIPARKDPLFPESADLAQVVEELGAVEQTWDEYLGGLT